MTPRWYHRLLIGGETGPDVDVVHRKLALNGSVYDEAARQYVRGIQQTHGLDVTGILDPDVAAILGEAADAHLTPEWFSRPLSIGVSGPDVHELRRRLLPAGSDTFDDDLRRAVLRFQSARALPLTGMIDESQAKLLP